MISIPIPSKVKFTAAPSPHADIKELEGWVDHLQEIQRTAPHPEVDKELRLYQWWVEERYKIARYFK